LRTARSMLSELPASFSAGVAVAGVAGDAADCAPGVAGAVPRPLAASPVPVPPVASAARRRGTYNTPATDAAHKQRGDVRGVLAGGGGWGMGVWVGGWGEYKGFFGGGQL